MKPGEVPKVAASFGRAYGIRTQAGILAASAAWRELNGIPPDTTPAPEQETQNPTTDLLRAIEAAELLSVSQERVNQLARSGRLPFEKVEGYYGPQRMFRRADVVAFRQDRAKEQNGRNG